MSRARLCPRGFVALSAASSFNAVARTDAPGRGRLAVRLAFVAAAACGAAVAPAAEKPLPLIPSWKQSHLKPGDQAVQSVYKLAACARIQRREAAEAVLDTVPGSAEEQSRMAVPITSGA